MDWIERCLGVSPDGGSGALELLLIAVPVIALASLFCFRHLRDRSRKAL